MKWIKTFIGLGLLWGITACGTAKIQKREKTIDRQFGAFERSGYVERARTWLPIIQDNMVYALSKRPSKRYEFPFIQEHTQVIRAENKKLRIFSWDNRAGSREDYWSVIAQYRGKGGKVFGTMLTDGYYTGADAFISVSVKKIFVIEDCNQTYYMTLGYDKNEAEQERWVFQILQVIEDKLVVCRDCFDGEKELIANLTEGEEFNYTFDPEKKSIQFLEFVIEPDGGDISREVIYNWNNCKFERQKK